jgi:hypothetical protein
MIGREAGQHVAEQFAEQLRRVGGRGFGRVDLDREFVRRGHESQSDADRHPAAGGFGFGLPGSCRAWVRVAGRSIR